MSYTIPSVEPTEIMQADVVKWYADLADYRPASWTLTYAFVPDIASGTAVTIDAADNSDGRHLMTVSAVQSAALEVGRWRMVKYVTDASSNRYTLGTYFIDVKTNPASPATDARTHVKKMLDLIRAVLEGRADSSVLSESDDSRSLQYKDDAELIRLERHYTRLYNEELQRARLAAGLGRSDKVQFRA